MTTEATTSVAFAPGESTTPAPTDARPRTTTTPVEAWAADLDELDRRVRNAHPYPSAIHPESEWVAKIAELKTSLPMLTGDEQMVQFASLVGLLDTHSSFDGLSKPDGPLLFRFYQLFTVEFADGTFVLAAAEPSLIGDRIVSIGGVCLEVVKARLMPLFLPTTPPGNRTSWTTC